MNGKKFLFDTNAIIALLNNNTELLGLTKNAEWIGISIISFIEFLAFPGLSDNDKIIFEKFVSRVNVIPLQYDDSDFIRYIVDIRKKYKIKLPDSIIVSSALINNAELVTADKEMSRVSDVKVRLF